MSFLRPELAAALSRRREALAWGAMLALGLLLVWRGYARVDTLVLVAGACLALAGLALLRGALVRMRLAAERPGPGVATTDEGRIGYWGPQGGGFVDLAEIDLVAVTGAPGRERAWTLRTRGGGELRIPFGAVGAEALPDALAALPGLDLQAAAAAEAVVWRRAAPADRIGKPREPRRLP